MEEQKLITRLQEAIEHAKTSTFYQKHLLQKHIETLEDFKNIPFLTKDELRNHSPFGLLAVRKEKLVQYHESSGTTGEPISIWYSEQDLQNIVNRTNETAVFFSKNDTMIVRFPYAMSIIAHTMQDTGKSNKTCIIPADSRTSITPMTRIIELLRKCETTILSCMSLHAIMLAEVAINQGLDPKVDFPHLRAICTAGEPITSYRRNLIKDIWGVPIFDNYGMTETGTIMVDCMYHHLHPALDDFYIEVLEDDFKTSTKQGEIGNLVITTLNKSATPMIRYKTGDTVKVQEELCQCGKQIYEIHGRKELLWKVKGRQFDIWDLEGMISPLSSRKFWAAGTRDHVLYVVIERENTSDYVDCHYLDLLRDQYGIEIKIYIVEKGALYDRQEPLSFGMKGKPKYILTQHELDYILNSID
ncbi:phenylacetate--CoA ligase family protein [Metabacillus litoralis]|uniref:phenylacetate--CoA ligase family protein n=1 Tax=Metabacillus litoralis TaxID=152268 RepID=UPI001CFD1BAB|nr:AMP-binding protein [Metabacillus litoralis]